LIHGSAGYTLPTAGWKQKATSTRSVKMVFAVQPGAILVVGDSFGAGSEVTDTDTWPAQLENKVGTRVLNAAVGGYGIDQSVLRAEELIPQLKPKMLIVQTNLAYGISSNRMSTAGGAPKPYFIGKLKFMNTPVPRGVSGAVDIGLRAQSLATPIWSNTP
jgi:hypothetical protein